MFVDPAVSEKKFDREIGQFREVARAYERRGIFLVEAAFPKVFAVIAGVNAKPAPVIPFAALIDFSDYDISPPSVHLVNPFTREKLKRSEIAYDLLRSLPAVEGASAPAQVQPLLQAFVDDRPFICLQGVREYHESPAHTGDSWFLHRGTGAGTLAFILDVLVRYGAEPIRGPAIHVQMNVTGFAVSAPPT